MDELPDFLPTNNPDLKIKQEPEDENENEESENINEEEEEEEEPKKDNDNNSEDDDDDSMDIDEDRLTLPQIRERIKKKQAKTKNISLLSKKTTRAQNITYDANTKSLRDCFVPDMEQLNDFLKKCVVKEIVQSDFTSLLKDRKQDVFDPQEFMLTNGITKPSISIEDLSLFKNNKNNKGKVPEISIVEEKQVQSLNKPKMTVDEFISTSIYKSKDKEHKDKVREQFLKFRKIMSTNILTLDQKKFLAEFIKNINALPIEEILVKDKKFEIVFDLDNTCMFSYLCGSQNGKEEGNEIISKYKNKNIKFIQFEYQGKKMYSILILRKGLKEFIEYIKDLANFHISTLASKNYAEKIAEVLANLFNIEFQKFSSRNDNNNKNRKYINDLNNDKLFPQLSESNTIIFDDSVSVWENESFNVIPSKKFYDKELRMSNMNNKSKSDLDIFLDTYTPYSYNQFKEGKEPSWKTQSIVTKINCPFYQYKNKDTIDYNESFFAEYLDSPKNQFIYMKNVIKVLYCLVFHNDIDISAAIKLVRLNALNGKIFYLKFLNDEQKSILRDIIKVCGGELYYPPIGEEESIIDLTKKIFLVVSKREFTLFEKEIKKEINMHKNYILINEKFILDSYYFMTDLGDSYTDKEYTDFIDNE